MKNLTPKLAPLALAFLALTACDRKPAAPADPRPRVLVSNPPTAWLVKQIAGDKVIVQTLAGPAGCGHDFQPTDKQMVEASKADIWFTCGLEFEKAEWTKGIKKTPVCEGAHAWMSLPTLSKMSSSIRKDLMVQFPTLLPDDTTLRGAIATGFVTRATPAQLIDTRNAVLIRDVIPLIKGTTFLSDHPAYTYFASDYNLHQITIEEDGHEPTDADLAKVIAQAKAAHVKILFLSSEEHRAEAEAVAKAVGAQVILADPNTENTPELLEMMANALVKAHGK